MTPEARHNTGDDTALPASLRGLWAEACGWAAWLANMFDLTRLRTGIKRETGARLSIWLGNIEGAVRRLFFAAALAIAPSAPRNLRACAAARTQPQATVKHRPRSASSACTTPVKPHPAPRQHARRPQSPTTTSSSPPIPCSGSAPRPPRAAHDPAAAIARAARRLHAARASILLLARDASTIPGPPRRAAQFATAGHTASFFQRCQDALARPDTS